MELRSAGRQEMAALREEHRRSSPVGIEPLFLMHLVEQATRFVIEEASTGDEAPARLGYTLLLARPHAGHSHVTVVELHLTPDHETRYEDVLDLIKEKHRPSAYLVRTDDCRLSAALLARGQQVELAALVMLPADDGDLPTRGITRDENGIRLTALALEHLPALETLITDQDAPLRVVDKSEAHDGDVAAHAHVHSPGSPDVASVLTQLEALARDGRSWVVLKQGKPLAVVARQDGGDGTHELLDVAVARAGETDLIAALLRAGEAVSRNGYRPAAVIDATEAARRRLFRKAGYYSAAAYMVFYDSETGRPSVGILSLAELRAMIDRKEPFHLVDVLGEEHWRRAHLPGAEWVDFENLARESRRRFTSEESIVVYCDGFT